MVAYIYLMAVIFKEIFLIINYVVLVELFIIMDNIIKETLKKIWLVVKESMSRRRHHFKDHSKKIGNMALYMRKI